MNEIFNIDCIEHMQAMPSESVDCILTDPPYKYLKNQKLESDFDEDLFFKEAKRILKKDAMLTIFGRGSSFYRWCYILETLGFNFKEEIIWDKGYSSSPVLAISRTHETIAIFAKGNTSIRKVKIPYLEMKQHDIASIVQDIKRLNTVFSNFKSLEAVKEFLQINQGTQINRPDLERGKKKYGKHRITRGAVKDDDRCVSVAQAMQYGMTEKSIIRNDFKKTDTVTKHSATVSGATIGSGDRCVVVANAIENGMNEKSIIKEQREHYSTEHPTQKPVRLFERLLMLISDPNALIFDPFLGSGTTALACINTNRNFLGCEIDPEYFQIAQERIKQAQRQTKMF